MGWREVIVSLNAIGIGDLDTIRKKIDQARRPMLESGQQELAAKLAEAEAALVSGQFAEYRRLLSLVVSRLGHLKE